MREHPPGSHSPACPRGSRGFSSASTRRSRSASASRSSNRCTATTRCSLIHWLSRIVPSRDALRCDQSHPAVGEHRGQRQPKRRSLGYSAELRPDRSRRSRLRSSRKAISSRPSAPRRSCRADYPRALLTDRPLLRVDHARAPGPRDPAPASANHARGSEAVPRLTLGRGNSSSVAILRRCVIDHLREEPAAPVVYQASCLPCRRCSRSPAPRSTIPARHPCLYKAPACSQRRPADRPEPILELATTLAPECAAHAPTIGRGRIAGQSVGLVLACRAAGSPRRPLTSRTAVAAATARPVQILRRADRSCLA